MVKGISGAGVQTTIGKGVWRDVHDAQNARTRQVNLETARLPGQHFELRKNAIVITMKANGALKPRLEASRSRQLSTSYATVGAGSAAGAGACVPPSLEPGVFVGGVQSLGGRGSLPAMMSSN